MLITHVPFGRSQKFSRLKTIQPLLLLKVLEGEEACHYFARSAFRLSCGVEELIAIGQTARFAQHVAPALDAKASCAIGPPAQVSHTHQQSLSLPAPAGLPV
jgi:hypothetical protein